MGKAKVGEDGAFSDSKLATSGWGFGDAHIF